MNTYYLACDLGAESGRLMLGSLQQDRLFMEELHRFPNTPIKNNQSLHWNIPQLLSDLTVGLKIAAHRNLPIASISTDAWGVDYVLLAPDGSFLSPCFHYRDPRSQRGVDNAHAKIPWETIFAETGVQFMPFNTLYQLMAEPPSRLQQARHLLGMGDAFNYFLCGNPQAEVSFASTSQLYNPSTRQWSNRLINALDLPPTLLPTIIPSGTPLGTLHPHLAKETQLRPLQVIASCSHDTAAAVAAIPATPGHWAYLSSGTWSLMGVELDLPIINDTARTLNFTNEIGYNHSIRLLKNIVGLWIVQECRRHWENQGQPYDYAALTLLAQQSTPFASLINPADPRFISPDNMPAKISSFCVETGQQPPTSPGATIRCALESLALLYRRTLLQIDHLIGRQTERLHIVGGGSKNSLLNQFTANALQIPVIAGPAEATAAGNVLIQALALGHIPSLNAARQIVQNSSQLLTVLPEDPDPWLQANTRFERLL